MIFPWAAGDCFDRQSQWEGEILTYRGTLSSANPSASLLPPRSVLSQPTCQSQMVCLAQRTVCAVHSCPFFFSFSLFFFKDNWSICCQWGDQSAWWVGPSEAPCVWGLDLTVTVKASRGGCYVGPWVILWSTWVRDGSWNRSACGRFRCFGHIMSTNNNWGSVHTCVCQSEKWNLLHKTLQVAQEKGCH